MKVTFFSGTQDSRKCRAVNIVIKFSIELFNKTRGFLKEAFMEGMETKAQETYGLKTKKGKIFD